MKTMTPMKIIMLLEIHCFVFLEQISMMNGSPAAHDAFDWLVIHELIEDDPRHLPPETGRTNSTLRTTARGKALLEKLCSVELPVLEEKWV